MTFGWGLVIGVFIGTGVGIIISAFLFVAKQSDKQAEVQTEEELYGHIDMKA